MCEPRSLKATNSLTFGDPRRLEATTTSHLVNTDVRERRQRRIWRTQTSKSDDSFVVVNEHRCLNAATILACRAHRCPKAMSVEARVRFSSKKTNGFREKRMLQAVITSHGRPKCRHTDWGSSSRGTANTREAVSRCYSWSASCTLNLKRP